MKISRLGFCLLLALFLTACGSRRVTLAEPFTLADGETVKVAGTDLTIQSKGVGREWDEQDEYAFVDMLVETGSVEKKITLYLGDERQIDGYIITLLSADPFGNPPSCDLSVTRP